MEAAVLPAEDLTREYVRCVVCHEPGCVEVAFRLTVTFFGPYRDDDPMWSAYDLTAALPREVFCERHACERG